VLLTTMVTGWWESLLVVRSYDLTFVGVVVVVEMVGTYELS